MLAKTITFEMEKNSSALRDAAVVIFSSLLLSLFGQLAIPLPFSPIPIGTQNGLVLLLALLLGSERAIAAVLLFLAQGAIGLPVFANGGAGWGVLAGPRGGYLIGYLFAAYVTGKLIEKWKEKTLLKTALALGAGVVTIYIFGASYLSTFLGVKKALLLGVAPFLLGDILKVCALLKIAQWFRGS